MRSYMALIALNFRFQESLGAQQAHNEWRRAQRDANSKWSEDFVNGIGRDEGAAHG